MEFPGQHRATIKEMIGGDTDALLTALDGQTVEVSLHVLGQHLRQRWIDAENVNFADFLDEVGLIAQSGQAFSALATEVCHFFVVKKAKEGAYAELGALENDLNLFASLGHFQGFDKQQHLRLKKVYFFRAAWCREAHDRPVEHLIAEAKAIGVDDDKVRNAVFDAMVLRVNSGVYPERINLNSDVDALARGGLLDLRAKGEEINPRFELIRLWQTRKILGTVASI